MEVNGVCVKQWGIVSSVYFNEAGIATLLTSGKNFVRSVDNRVEHPVRGMFELTLCLRCRS
jgi:hypothetical protein